MAEQYLSIKEFAELANVSIQSVYKRIKKPDDIIHNFIKVKDGKKFVLSSAAEQIYNTNVSEYEQIEDTEKQDYNIDIISLLQEQIEQQKKEIEFKNNQIIDLTEQLKESSERETNYQKLLNQQQQLTAAEKQKTLQLESETQKKRKSLFSWFLRKTKEEVKE